MDRQLPPWVTFEHDALHARWGKTRGERVAAVGILALAIVWTAIAVPLMWTSLGAGCVALVALVVLWPLGVGMVWTMTDRFALRIGRDAVWLTRWRYGRQRRWILPTPGLTVQPGQFEGSKGATHITLDLTSVDGQTMHVPLPGGDSLRERDAVKAHLAWMVDALQEVARAADHADAPDPAVFAAVSRLVDRA